MTDNHPITPPPELFKQWAGMPRSLAFEAAYRAGADHELEACCEWLQEIGPSEVWLCGDDLRRDRRPKTSNLKEQALAALDLHFPCTAERDIIRRALEQLDD